MELQHKRISFCGKSLFSLPVCMSLNQEMIYANCE
uniref:Uncharacterized protein n=1 Tax=Rhizophora mucronata TaxID=61149 RepID=A0A2P2NZP6_RHIMU